MKKTEHRHALLGHIVTLPAIGPGSMLMHGGNSPSNEHLQAQDMNIKDLHEDSILGSPG